MRDDLIRVQRLVGLLRANVPQLGLLSVEVLLLCAEGPKTAAELERRTGAANGPVMRACWPSWSALGTSDQQAPGRRSHPARWRRRP